MLILLTLINITHREIKLHFRGCTAILNLSVELVGNLSLADKQELMHTVERWFNTITIKSRQH